MCDQKIAVLFVLAYSSCPSAKNVASQVQNSNRKLVKYLETFENTVLSGAEERGVDGPSLDRSYFSRLQPISFLFYNPSSSHVG